MDPSMFYSATQLFLSPSSTGKPKRRKRTAKKHAPKPLLDMDDQPFIKLDSDSESDSNLVPWAAIAAWEVLSTPLEQLLLLVVHGSCCWFNVPTGSSVVPADRLIFLLERGVSESAGVYVSSLHSQHICSYAHMLVKCFAAVPSQVSILKAKIYLET
ncbi:hypothetical protein Tco_1082953 [Tanacetum coccineum]|uniref:Uncharacterized protein n=1 Tax=Tanacetum coccineum TaxID=301880 RepID=A0ABQ5I237_9ASTR